ncbi:ComEA family DNA-binding protein [Costertonia aggregata]|uniref:Helix-hairpin-helix domain-containing protein n=1 Tax=Costertonia aggregata TaxID=343403 RepID=A0A7H9ALB7_9FLAO|nr:helix-hairpin-helix domain-containing protein [Costertonia aggregata]QLG44248.1 helix-hairpin-helix domain-containing protein [Costertonia aggregata]
MKNFKSHFKFNTQERSGIFFLLLIIVFLQTCYFLYNSLSPKLSAPSFSLDKETQTTIDALKQIALEEDSVRIYPFNPNFISDYKGYTMGLSPKEIDRLHSYREQGKYVNSPKEFQDITLVSDSLLAIISPYFKFPEWTQNNRKTAYENSNVETKLDKKENSNIKIKDLNSVTAEELKLVNGIGEKLSARIIKFRDRLGGFLIDEQLYDVYGLEPEVVEGTLKYFKVLNAPEIEKIYIDTATVEELSKLVYLQKWVAESIVNYRNLNGSITSFDELSKIEGFPSERIDRIALYLSLKK